MSIFVVTGLMAGSCRGPMSARKLTKTSVQTLTTRERVYIVYDEQLPGFGCRVTPGGAKSYVVEYRPHGGGRGVGKKRITLGSTNVITTEQARQAARDVLARVRFGEDAPHDRAGRRASALVSDLIDEFMRDEVRPTLKRSAFAKPRGQPSSYDVGGGLEAETVGIPWIIDRSSPKAKHVRKNDQRTVVSPFATAALRLLLLTGCRLRENSRRSPSPALARMASQGRLRSWRARPPSRPAIT